MNPHALLFTAAALLGMYVLMRVGASFKLAGRGYEIEWVAGAFIAGIVGARVGYVLLYPDQFASLSDRLKFWDGGLLSYTGLIAGVAWILSITYRSLDRQRWQALLALTTLLGWSLGRLGNFLIGDVVGSWIIPVPLIESLFMGLGAGLGYWYLRKSKHPQWELFPWLCLGWFGLARLAADLERVYVEPVPVQLLWPVICIAISSCALLILSTRRS